MTYLNEASALIALAMMALVARGFGTHLTLRGHSPVNYLMQGIFIGSIGIGARIALYDFIRPVMRGLDILTGPGMGIEVQLYNAGFNAIFALAAWRILVALHASLPEHERGRYNWLTAPFYPRRINLFRKSDQDG